MFRHTLVAAALAAAFPFAHAQSVELAPVIVTGNAVGSGLFDYATPATTINQSEISRGGATTLGDALKDQPGISANSFGPNASRPVIRGLDADRVRILSNGGGVTDLSALSPDHAVSIDPLAIEQIEIVRGPAALLYGGNAVGGVVNTLDNRIPQDAISGISGRGELRSGGADHQSGAAALVETGNGDFALHVDAFKRDTDDLGIPGYARSARLRATDPQMNEARDHLPNSSSQSDGAALGASWTFRDGYLGASFSNYNSDYGTVAEEGVRIALKSERADIAGEVRELDGFFTKLKTRISHTDYQHQEIDNGVVATTFNNQGLAGLFEATHRKIGNMSGVIGISALSSDVQVSGDEALLPDIEQRNLAAYVYEELPLTGVKLSFGARIERANIDSAGGGPMDPNTGNPRFGDAAQLDFTPTSAAFGALIPLATDWNLAANFSNTQRAPSYNELFANGPHAATGQYEIGNRALDVEKANGVDMQLRWKRDKHSASVGVFYTRFLNYISLFPTGNARDEDGTINPAGEFAETETRAVPAVFKGLEGEGKFRVYTSEAAGDLDLRIKADLVRADNRDTGQPLPRIAPWRLGLGLDYQRGNFMARTDLLYGAEQNRVAANELPTDDYLQFDLLLSYKLQTNAEIFLKGSNLLDEEIRLHSSTLKDNAPLGGRSVLIGLRGNF